MDREREDRLVVEYYDYDRARREQDQQQQMELFK